MLQVGKFPGYEIVYPIRNWYAKIKSPKLRNYIL